MSKLTKSEDESFNDYSSNLTANIKRLRLQKGFAQERLAYESKVDRTLISKIERGAANPTLGVLCKVSYALGVQISDLLNPPA